MCKSILVFFFLALTTITNPIAQTECQKFIQKFIQDIMNFNLMNLPLPVIMYSGISTNNPGQFKECNNAHFNYYLIYMQNKTQGMDIFTSVCMPKQCSAKDVEEALAAFVISTVYDYANGQQNDGLSIAGIVIISIWLTVLTIWSCVVFLKEQQVKQQLEKPQKQRTSINQQHAQHLIASVVEPTPQIKLFNFYDGYQQLFKVPKKKNIFSPIILLSTIGYLAAIQYSYRMSISENQETTALNIMNSFGGIFICNTEIVLHCIMFIFGLRLAYITYKINSFAQIPRFFFDQVLKKWVLLVLMTFFIYSFLTNLTDEPLNKVWNLNNGQDCPGVMWQYWFLFRNMVMDCKRCLPWMSIFSTQIFLIIISIPFLIVFKTSKKLGYSLFSLLIVVSMLSSYAILDSRNIVFEPAKLMNGQKQFVYDYQTNTFVRMGAFMFGLMFGLFLIEGLEKSQSHKPYESEMAKKIRRTSVLQVFLQTFGSILMLLNFLLIIPYLNKDAENKKPYGYLIFSPFFFIIGLALFILPSFWEGHALGTKLVNKIFGWKKFVHLDKMTTTLLMIGPMIMGFTNYGMQSSMFYEWSSISIYFIGDLILSYIVSVLIASSFECQLNSIALWLQNKVYGNELKYSILVIQE